MTSIIVANPDMILLVGQMNISSRAHMQLVNTKTFFPLNL